MQKEKLKAVAKKFVDEYSKKSYSELESLAFPVTFEYQAEGSIYDIEIERLEVTEEYVHIIVAVSSGGLSAYLPETNDFIVHKSGKIEK